MPHDAPELPILLVEDDLDLAANIQDFLEHSGWRVDYAANGAIALHRLLTEDHCAALLDLNLPGVSGLELSQKIRAHDKTAALPILMLTAADSLEDRLNGFAHGADDYLVKPFEFAELQARLEAVMRRSQGALARPSKGHLLNYADIELDPALREVRRGGEVLTVTNMGFSLLELLIQSAPAVVPKSKIEHCLWGDEPPGSDALRTHIAALRAELDSGSRKALLKTHRGIGYQLLD